MSERMRKRGEKETLRSERTVSSFSLASAFMNSWLAGGCKLLQASCCFWTRFVKSSEFSWRWCRLLSLRALLMPAAGCVASRRRLSMCKKALVSALLLSRGRETFRRRSLTFCKNSVALLLGI